MIEAIKQALEALEFFSDTSNSAMDKAMSEDAITSLRQAIAEAEKHKVSQEPFEDLATELFVVAQISPADDGFSETIERIESWLREHFTHPPQLEQNFCPRCGKRTNDIHTCTPPQPKQKPLTDEKIDDLSRMMVKGNKSVNWLVKAIEAAHGIKGKA